LFTEFIVVSAQRFDYIPHRLECRSVESRFRVVAYFDKHGNHDGADHLLLGETNGAAYGLNDVDL
jgi:hypothetical protein